MRKLRLKGKRKSPGAIRVGLIVKEIGTSYESLHIGHPDADCQK